MALVRRFLSLFLAAVLDCFATAFASLPPFMPDCPVDFGYQNYTIITSRCKAPRYPRTECCDAFRDFACPFAVYINNQSTNCVDTMISNINFMGKYPEGLLNAECLKGKEGFSCQGIQGMDTGVSIAGQQAQRSSGSLIALLCGLGALLFH